MDIGKPAILLDHFAYLSYYFSSALIRIGAHSMSGFGMFMLAAHQWFEFGKTE